MYPEIAIPYLPHPVSAQGTCIGCAVVVCFLIGPPLAAHLDGIRPHVTRRALVYLAAAAFMGGRVHYVFNYRYAYVHHLGAAFGSWPSGLHAPGAVAALVAALPLVCLHYGVSPWRFADAVAPTIAVGVAIARLGCFLQGCCYGRACDGWWCARFPHGPTPVHPLQLYFLLSAATIAVVGLGLARQKPYDGVVSLLLFSATTAILEFLRADAPGRVYWGPLPQLEWTAVFMTTLALLALGHAERASRLGVASRAAQTRCANDGDPSDASTISHGHPA